MKVLIAAGGAGQEVAAAALRIAYLTGSDIPKVVVFDSDVATRPPAQGAMTRTQALNAIEQQLLALGVISEPKLTVLNPTVIPGAEAHIDRVDQIYANHGSLGPVDEDLLELLLDSDQRQTPVSNGFHGEPAVGALVFSGAWHLRAFDSLVDELRNGLAERDGLRVVLTASVAGGVGTSVLPVLIRELSELRRANRGSRLDLLALLQLPWFRLMRASGDPLSREPDVNQADFDRNAGCLLKGYLKDTLSQNLDSLLVLGLPQPVDRVSHGGEQQLETRHYISLCAGMVALNMLRQEATEQMFGGEWKGLHALALGTSKKPSPMDGPSAGPAVYLSDGSLFSVGKLIDMARCLVGMTDALRFESSVDEAAMTHHGSVAQALRELESRYEREQFRKHVEAFHVLHVDILQWLQATLESKVGAGRADSLHAFEPDGNWSTLFGSGVWPVLRRCGVKFSPLPTSRTLLSKLGGYTLPATGATGQQMAWSFVEQAHVRLRATLS